MYELDELTPSYIMSVFCEEYYKPMVDEYLAKVLVSGSVTPLKELTQYQNIFEEVL